MRNPADAGAAFYDLTTNDSPAESRFLTTAELQGAVSLRVSFWHHSADKNFWIRGADGTFTQKLSLEFDRNGGGCKHAGTVAAGCIWPDAQRSARDCAPDLAGQQ